MLFEKTSTRTRVSFDVAMRQLGGETIVLNHSDMQLGRGETVADTACVLSRYVDIIMMRAMSHETLIELAHHATVPVINGLSDRLAPLPDPRRHHDIGGEERPVEPLVVTWIGDGNNVLPRGSTPPSLRLHSSSRHAQKSPATSVSDEWAQSEGGKLVMFEDPREAAEGADCVVTDVWVSMGQEKTAERIDLLKPYQVNMAVMEKAAKDAIFMHCLPAHRGREVTDEIIRWATIGCVRRGGNRLHAQRAILARRLQKV